MKKSFPSEYDEFLDTYIASTNNPTTKTENPKLTKNRSILETRITPGTVKTWGYPTDIREDDRKIYEDIFKKFNNHNKFAIGKTFATSEPEALGAYSFEGDLEDPQSENDYSYFSFPPLQTDKRDNPYIPEPKTIAHEVVHANDHQIDHLTPQLWGDLRTLYDKDPSTFDQSINKLRNKINQKVFGISSAYAPKTVLDTINTEMNQFNREVPGGDFNDNPRESRYTTLIKKGKNKGKYQNAAGEIYENKEYDWQSGLPKMQELVNLQNTRSGNQNASYTIPNYHFKGTFASEFPAFALTNLTNRWRTTEQTGTNEEPILPLGVNEQEFLYNMLGHAENAYPSGEYPTVNNYIRARRNSITDTDMWQQTHPITPQAKSSNLVNLPLKRITENPDPGPTKIARFAGGGYVRGNNSYDPYLNTYNYAAPLRFSEYLTDQMPSPGYDTGGYDDPYMSYGNAYDDDGQQYSFREGGAVERGNPNFPRLLDVIGEGDISTPIRSDIVNKAKELSQIVINDSLKANNGKLDESALIQGFAEISNSLNLNEVEKNQVERFVENIFKNSQFNDSPGYFYEKAHGMTNNIPTQSSFKRGGTVDVDRGELPRLADLIQRYGRNGDTELAHINPIEAHILKSLGGSGTINPATGLREYGFFKNPFKAIKSVLGGGAGALLGNMIAPGIGGIIGGALGQGAQHAARGKSALSGALKGAGMGAALPSVASGLGWGASRLGATALGSSLSNYGSTNAILPALGMGSSSGSSGLFGLGGSNPYVSGGLSSAAALSQGMGTGRGQGLGVSSGDYAENYYNYMLDRQKKQDNMGFTDKLQDYLTEPKNLLTLGTVAAQYAGRQKPKSPEKIAEEERRYRNASRKTIAEVEADEALETARGDLQKKRKNKQLEEDIKNMGSVRRRVVSPEEFARTGRWLEYEDEEGRPIRMKGGGSAHSPYAYLTEEIYSPLSPIGYLSGDSGGQDDLIDAKLSDGEYVFDASTVSDLGDGNNAAGARKLDGFRENIRRHKRGGKVMLPPRSKSLESYLRG